MMMLLKHMECETYHEVLVGCQHKKAQRQIHSLLLLALPLSFEGLDGRFPKVPITLLTVYLYVCDGISEDNV